MREMRFVLREVAGLDDVSRLPGYEDSADLSEPILEEAATFASEILDPLNQRGDREGCSWNGGTVTMPSGFKDAYARFAAAGWIGLPVAPEYGGQGLPALLLAPTLEMWNAANIGFANGPLLNQGAIEAIEIAGSNDQKQRFIPRLVDGTWMGTMCLTEPQAGSDLAQVRTRAVPDRDHYRLSGQKIFITFGEHDMAENIIHLVLARLPDAPEGTKGISLFIVPKFLIGEDDSLGPRNDVVCAGIEHKMGLNANPTCTMNYGERGGALAYLLGEPHQGLKYMFVMMNAARFSVGVQGMAVADRAYHSALQYAKERVQFRRIIEHPDVRRMLMDMKSRVEAMRALAYTTAASIDFSRRDPDPGARARHRSFVDLLIPIVKGWCTESAIDIASTAMQVFGGVGYVEETGIAQQYRDVRVSAIYEGTTGIQAADLVGRKIASDGGETAAAAIGRMRDDAGALSVAPLARALLASIDLLEKATRFVADQAREDIASALACSVPYLMLWGTVAGGWQLGRAAGAAASKAETGDAESEFYAAKVATAKYYASHVLSRTAALAHEIVVGSGDVMALSEQQLDLDRKNAALT